MSTDYPECNKLSAVSDKSRSIGEFLDWLVKEREPRVSLMVAHSPETDEDGDFVFRDKNGDIVEGWKVPSIFDDKSCQRQEDKGICCHRVPDPQGSEYLMLLGGFEKLLCEYFEIDMVKVEEERRQMLEACQEG